ncbi:MAG: UvrD-helicase domain-containing protein, partial [Eubacteriales bacterium]|nr:UvrD-helicase domain-containing protein [Eubacteriales bacterium]
MELTGLNKEQLRAVECVDGPLLVLAGAGSGKTRVLTYRIANLIENHQVRPYQILALTFTNKAAKEMRERTQRLVDVPAEDIWVMTFHAFCMRILRRDIQHIGYERSFTIYDDADQLSVINNIIKNMGLDDKKFPKRQLREHISRAKNQPGDPLEYFRDEAFGADTLLNVYKQYQKRLKDNNALDFDDLLLKTLELFHAFPEVLGYYQNRFRYVLVDEYQDTNMAQYELVKLLSREHHNICVVGDDDQSIYGWRGADIRNILEFEKDFPGAKTIRLEQNYRSTNVILDAANSVIENNSRRKSKKLWTAQKGGEPLHLFVADNERYEAAYVCDKIMSGVHAGRRYDEFAILYRMNAQSRMLETLLMHYGIPYHVYGGLRFYERKEIKDVMAYLRLLCNPADDVAFERAIAVPKRGLGAAAMAELAAAATENGTSLFLAAMEAEALSPRCKAKFRAFADEVRELMVLRFTLPLSKFAEEMLKRIEYDAYLREDKKENYETRAENVAELIGAMRAFEEDAVGVEDMLQAYLENVALVSDLDNMADDSGQVALMTLHSAK